MLAGETMLCFAPDPWAGLWRNRHQIMTRLARRNTVVYVEPRTYFRQALRAARAGKLGWSDLTAPRLVHERDGLYIYRDPVYAPHAGRLSGGPLTAAIRRRAMRAALRSLRGSPPILWLLRPFQADQIGVYGEKLVVYQVTDEYSGFPTVADKAGFRVAEEALLRRADVVLVTSPALLRDKGRFNGCTFLVPNAVDYAGFQAALAQEAGSAQESGRPLVAPTMARLGEVGRPRIGYVGALNEKIDFDLLAAVAREHSEWHFVLVGGLDLTGSPHKADGLAALPNVSWLGRVPVEQVPAAISAMDVCLLPYEQNPWTAAIDSLKLYEYFACGKPVVATDVPAVHAPFAEGLVRTGDGVERFAEQIATVLADVSAEQVAARKAAAAANTWDDRVAQIEGILGDALERKRAGGRCEGTGSVIEGESFVYFGPEQWQSMWRNRHQLLTRLARANKVVYVEPRPYIEQTIGILTRRETSLWRMLRAPRLQPDRENLWLYWPPKWAPLGGPGPVRALTHALRKATMRRDIASLGVDRGPIVWISTPTQHDARLDLPARLRVYHIVDDYLAYHDLPEAHRSQFAERERELIDWADLVITVSPELVAAKGAGNPKFRLLPNGFDAAAYSAAPSAGAEQRVTPAELSGLPRPILGYVGLISVRLDLRLLDKLAAAHPEWTLVLMGTVYRNGCEDVLDWLSGRPNVHVLPAVPGEQVADFVRSFDVGLVPYRVTQETVHASPLKVYEYLAAGLPVVATDVPGARQFADTVSIVSTRAEWETAIAEAIGEAPACDDEARRMARRAAVAPHTWDARVETLSGFLTDALSRK